MAETGLGSPLCPCLNTELSCPCRAPVRAEYPCSGCKHTLHQHGEVLLSDSPALFHFRTHHAQTTLGTIPFPSGGKAPPHTSAGGWGVRLSAWPRAGACIC